MTKMDKQFEMIFQEMVSHVRSGEVSTYDQRRQWLKALRLWILANENRLKTAIAEDFGHRSYEETEYAEIIPTLNEIHATLKNLKSWMKPKRRGTNFLFFPASSKVIYQPKGTALILSPWNYPFLLTVGPLIAGVAAGCRIIVKPSEFCPKTSELIDEMVRDVFPKDYITVILGDAALSAELTNLPFDHIFFTGSTMVGKKVMAAASQNLSSVTLELGGKSPALLIEPADWKRDVFRLVKGKLLNAGQTCVAPDYVLLNEKDKPRFIELYKKAARSFYPGGVKAKDYTSIINDKHYERLVGLVDAAKDAGAEVIEVLGSFASGGNERKLAPVLVSNVNDDMAIMQEEIFGPPLPIITYDTLDEAIAFINKRDHPLAFYVFDQNKSRIDTILHKTLSGGVTVNDTILHLAQDDLPFGGVGPSGMGAYHGEAGFKAFSHERSIFTQSRFSGFDLIRPPYGARFKRLMKMAKLLR